MKSQDIRKSFLEFFKSKQHLIVPSAPMVVKNDPTLMFTNAGMNQFKDVFLGNKKPEALRVADTQKCLRVSGKHNDLEEVGHDTYHHTMFEMLGNWSFGDYFKKEAIAWAWEFLREKCDISEDRLYATVFGGDKTELLERDEEAYSYWTQFLPEDHILDGNKKDNFWEMGEQGPCGPCSEIHVDLRDDSERSDVSGATLINTGHPQVIEIWNLVFIQYNRKANSLLEVLPAQHVDTGMGFERLCMAMQGKKSNYDTDIFMPLIDELSTLSGKPYRQNEQVDVAMRVIADHVRAIAFAIADGQLPSNVKAGYVIRRILRRAVRYGYTFLGFREPFINKLIPVFVYEMGDYFSEIKKQQELITKVITEEESSFLRTLANGILKFEHYISDHKNLRTIDGAFSFELFDTYGFPIDLTQLMAKEQGLNVNMIEFQKHLEEQKNRSRQAAAIDTDDWVEINKGEQTQFTGYDVLSCEVKILRYRKVKTKDTEFYQLVFNQTPFYAESGGQIGDSGSIEAGNERIEVFNTKKENTLIVHLSLQLPSDVSTVFIAKVNNEKRRQTEANHTATHLLHKALRTVLGTHVEQKGSLVESSRLRFDFSHFSKLSPDELRTVEQMVNDEIRHNVVLEDYRAVSLEEANQMGAMALFGEKYSDVVRVVKFGESVEFCGGTHVSATGNIGFFKIVSEGAISAGVRRIEAVTGEKAETLIYEVQDTLSQLHAIFNNPKVIAAAERMMAENEELKRSLEELRHEKMVSLAEKLTNEASTDFETRIMSMPIPADTARELATILKTKAPRLAVIIGFVANGKVSLSVALGDEFVAKGLSAVDIVRTAAKEIEGGGGGQAWFASAGGRKAEGLQNAIETAKKLLEQ